MAIKFQWISISGGCLAGEAAVRKAHWSSWALVGEGKSVMDSDLTRISRHNEVPLLTTGLANEASSPMLFFC